MIYGCKRTASIISTKYSTLAKCTPEDFRLLTPEFPNIEENLKKQVQLYYDPMKVFIEQSLRKIEYF